MLGKEQLSQGVDKCGGEGAMGCKGGYLISRSYTADRTTTPSLCPETKWGEHAGKYAVVRVFRDDCLSVAGPPSRYFHFWKATGNCTNWKFKLATVYWTEEEEEEQILDRKAQKAKEENDDEC